MNIFTYITTIIIIIMQIFHVGTCDFFWQVISPM